MHKSDIILALIATFVFAAVCAADTHAADGSVASQQSGNLAGSHSDPAGLQSGTVVAFEFSIDFPDPTFSPSILPDFLVYAMDESGKLDTSYDGAVNISLITPDGFSIGLDATNAAEGVASFSGVQIPEGEIGQGYVIEAKRFNPTIEGLSNSFEILDGDTDIEISAENTAPTVSAVGTVSTVVTVQILDKDKQPLEVPGIEILAEVAPSLAEDIDFPDSLLTESDGSASFGFQSEIAETYLVNFTVPALLESGTTNPVSDSVQLHFQPDAAVEFEFSADFPDPLFSPSILPGFSTYALDQFGNLDSSYDGAVNISLITPGGFSIVLDAANAAEGVASFSGVQIPEGESGQGYVIEARRSNPFIEGFSNTFEVINVPQADVSVSLNGSPAGSQNISQAHSYLLEIAADNVSVDPGYELAVLVSARGPLDAVIRPLDAFCSELLVGSACTALVSSTGLEAGFNSDTSLFEEEVTVRADAEPGLWELEFDLVLIIDDTPGDETYLAVDTLFIELSVNTELNAATGIMVATRNDEIFDPVTPYMVREGESIDFGLTVVDASVQASRRLAVSLEGQGPLDSSSRPFDEFCPDLMDAGTCAALQTSIGFDNDFDADIDLIDDLLIRILPDAALGEWVLSFSLVSFDTSASPPDSSVEVVSTLDLILDVHGNPAEGSLMVTFNELPAGSEVVEVIQNQSFDLGIELNDVDSAGLDGLAVVWFLSDPSGAMLDGQPGCELLLQSSDCNSLANVIGESNFYVDDVEVFNQSVTLQSDAASGAWQLDFWLVAIEDSSLLVMQTATQHIQVVSDQIFADHFLGID